MPRKSKAAYFYVDLSEIPEQHRQEVLEDAVMGGTEYGVREVETVHNGPARRAIYGVYYGPDEAKWAAAREQFGLDEASLTDEELEAREEALRESAKAEAEAEAAKIEAAEEAEVRRVTGETADEEAPKKNKAKQA